MPLIFSGNCFCFHDNRAIFSNCHFFYINLHETDHYVVALFFTFYMFFLLYSIALEINLIKKSFDNRVIFSNCHFFYINLHETDQYVIALFFTFYMFFLLYSIALEINLIKKSFNSRYNSITYFNNFLSLQDFFALQRRFPATIFFHYFPHDPKILTPHTFNIILSNHIYNHESYTDIHVTKFCV